MSPSETIRIAIVEDDPAAQDALRLLIEDTEGFRCTGSYGSAEQVKLSPVERRQLYLIFKEALHNVARHSGATSVVMSLSVSGRRLTAMIRDDGRGFDEPAEGDTRHGLGSMTSRAADLKGRLTIESASGRGTEVRLEVPLSGGNA